MLDSGTSYLYVPASVASAIYQPLNGQPLGDNSGFYAVPADTTLSSFTITFAGTAFNVNVEDLVLGFVDDTKQTVALTIIASDDTDPTGEPLAIVGDLFMKNVVTIFNYNQNGAPAVGFIPVTTSTTSGASAVGSAASSFGGSQSGLQTAGAQTPGIVSTTGTAGLSRSLRGSTGGGFPTGGITSASSPSSTSKSSAAGKVEASAATVLLLSLFTLALAL